MLRLITTLVSALLFGLRSRRALVLEPADRLFWVLLHRFWSKWADALAIVKLKTVVAWHRAGFSLYWKWLSRAGRPPGRPALDRQIRDLVRRMATENSWRAPRIHGELLKLGFQISESRATCEDLSTDRSVDRAGSPSCATTGS